jgi:hypothetical protein
LRTALGGRTQRRWRSSSLEDGHVDVAVSLGKPERMRPKQISLPDLGAGSERGSKGAHEGVGRIVNAAKDIGPVPA